MCKKFLMVHGAYCHQGTMNGFKIDLGSSGGNGHTTPWSRNRAARVMAKQSRKEAFMAPPPLIEA